MQYDRLSKEQLSFLLLILQ